jgi:hypothetical protein
MPTTPDVTAMLRAARYASDKEFLNSVRDALAEVICLAESWASCGPEGFTAPERKVVKRAERTLAQIDRVIGA